MLRFIYICIIFIFLVSCGTKSNLIQSEFENEKNKTVMMLVQTSHILV